MTNLLTTEKTRHYLLRRGWILADTTIRLWFFCRPENSRETIILPRLAENEGILTVALVDLAMWEGRSAYEVLKDVVQH
jgi:hypothetical protein